MAMTTQHPNIEHHHDLLAAWLDRIGEPVTRTRPLLHDAAADLARIAVAAPDDLPAALNRFGRRAATDGWDLAHVADWVRTLAAVLADSGATAPSEVVRGFDSGVALGRGWTTGFNHRTQLDGCTDPSTGLPTAALLRWRLRQTYDQCLGLGIDTPLAYAVVVVDLVASVSDVFVQNMARAHVAAQVRDAFPNGDAIVAAGSRLFVLTSSDAALADRVIRLTADLHCTPAIGALQVMAWVEPLPAHREHIDAYLTDLLA